MGRGLDCCGSGWGDNWEIVMERNFVDCLQTSTRESHRRDTSSKICTVLERAPCIMRADRWTDSNNFSAAVAECAYISPNRTAFGDIN
jgi:hypothetical protein